MEGNGDRRVRRTKRRLKRALLALIDECGYEAITIRDLTDRADVGRSTFYSHFRSKEDLLFEGFDRWVLSLAEGVRVPGTAGRPPADTGRSPDDPRRRAHRPDPPFRTRAFLEHARTRKRFFRATIAESPDPRVRRRLVEILTEAFLQQEAGSGRDAPGAADPLAGARAQARAGALLGVIGWWFDGHEGTDVETVAAVFDGISTSIGAGGAP